MTTGSFEALTEAVIASSVSDGWATAVREWDVVLLEENPAGDGVCVCGQNNLVKLFTIENSKNNSTLYPIGSTCVNQFGRADLDRKVDLFIDLHKLRLAHRENRPITLTSEYFSRAMLEYFYFEDVFDGDQWNNGDGERDYEFLLKMFNKRIKEDITTRQQSKIFMLLRHKVLPFVEADTRLR